MGQLLATFCKDLLLLWRDRAGLAILFLMPMALVLVISLVQNDIMEATGETALQVLYVDSDAGFVGKELRQRLEEGGGLELIDTLDETAIDANKARELVGDGAYQFAVLIPEGSSQALQEKLDRRLTAPEDDIQQGENGSPVIAVEIVFDPAVQGVFRTAVTASLRAALLGLESSSQMHRLSKTLRRDYGIPLPELDDSGNEALQVRQVLAGNDGETLRANAVQQNVPAWSLFGMFFIAVPLSGILIREREEGTLKRLLTLPVSYGALLAGKTLAYVTVCLIQFALMLLVGKTLLPLLGTPVLVVGDQLAAIGLLALCAALAATGYGLLIGTLARSHDQASMFGAVSVVIAAALGGVMVPVYVMPEMMQQVSRFSPLAWGLNGFIELFVRGGGVGAVVPNMLCLLGFFIATLGLALLVFKRHSRHGG